MMRALALLALVAGAAAASRTEFATGEALQFLGDSAEFKYFPAKAANCSGCYMAFKLGALSELDAFGQPIAGHVIPDISKLSPELSSGKRISGNSEYEYVTMSFQGPALAAALSRAACPTLESIVARAYQLGIQPQEGGPPMPLPGGAGVAGLPPGMAVPQASTMAVGAGLLPADYALAGPDPAALDALVSHGRRLAGLPVEIPVPPASFAVAITCPYNKTATNFELDSLGQAWGYDSATNQSCAFRTPAVSAAAAVAAAAGDLLAAPIVLPGMAAAAPALKPAVVPAALAAPGAAAAAVLAKPAPLPAAAATVAAPAVVAPAAAKPLQLPLAAAAAKPALLPLATPAAAPAAVAAAPAPAAAAAKPLPLPVGPAPQPLLAAPAAKPASLPAQLPSLPAALAGVLSAAKPASAPATAAAAVKPVLAPLVAPAAKPALVLPAAAAAQPAVAPLAPAAAAAKPAAAPLAPAAAAKPAAASLAPAAAAKPAVAPTPAAAAAAPKPAEPEPVPANVAVDAPEPAPPASAEPVRLPVVVAPNAPPAAASRLPINAEAPMQSPAQALAAAAAAQAAAAQAAAAAQGGGGVQAYPGEAVPELKLTFMFGFTANKTFPYGAGRVTAAPAGSVKFTVEAANWPFCSLYNTLKLELVAASTVKDSQPQITANAASEMLGEEEEEEGMDESSFPVPAGSARRLHQFAHNYGAGFFEPEEPAADDAATALARRAAAAVGLTALRGLPGMAGAPGAPSLDALAALGSDGAPRRPVKRSTTAKLLVGPGLAGAIEMPTYAFASSNFSGESNVTIALATSANATAIGGAARLSLTFGYFAQSLYYDPTIYFTDTWDMAIMDAESGVMPPGSLIAPGCASEADPGCAARASRRRGAATSGAAAPARSSAAGLVAAALAGLALL
ncbi:hypothetical protein HT031_001731 [Scenedesmus sp. PABB004]|nr:hypothetical protein HT031_001731 [Scenedesmus sp. PABB004]